MTEEQGFELSREWRDIAACVDAYEDSGSQGNVPDLRAFLKHAEPPHRLSALLELVKVDMEYCWKQGTPKITDQYVEEYPELRDVSVSMLDLAKSEHSVAAQFGDMTVDDDLTPRYPDFFRDKDKEDAMYQAAHDSLSFSDNTATETPWPPAPKIGRYTVVERIGQGGYGAVYRCHDEQLDRDVAIKLPRKPEENSKGITKEFLHEAQSAARLNHRGVVTILDTGETDDGNGFIVYEYISGRTLKDRLADGDFSRNQAVEWVAQLADALHYVHKNSLVHRDVKPGNILIDGQDNPLLTDFGLAKLDDKFFSDDTGSVLGTLGYMSPEQAKGESHWASPQSDIYSLGTVLYEVLCGRRPFKASTFSELREQVKRREPAPPRTIDDTIPQALEAVCLKAMAKSSTQRFTTAGDMAKAIRASVRGPVLTRRRLIDCLVAATVIGALVFALFPRKPEPGQPATPSALPVHDPPKILLKIEDFALDYQEADEEGSYHELVDEHIPLKPGDKLQLRVNVNRRAYLYLFWYDDDGKAELVWPPEHDQTTPQRVSTALGPVHPEPGKHDWMKVENNAGVNFALAVARDERLSDDELIKFREERFLAPKPVKEPMLVKVIREESDEENESITRGDNDNRITSPKYAIPSEMEETVSELSPTFGIIMISHFPDRNRTEN